MSGSAEGCGGFEAKNKTKTWSDDPSASATILENEKTVAPAGDEVAKRAHR